MRISDWSSDVCSSDLVWGIRETIDVDLSESITNSFIVNYSSTDNNPALSAFRGTRDPITGAPCAPERILANECVTAGGDRNPNPNPREGHSSLRETPYDIRSWGIENNLKYSGEAVNITPVKAYQHPKATHTRDAGTSYRTGVFPTPNR